MKNLNYYKHDNLNYEISIGELKGNYVYIYFMKGGNLEGKMVLMLNGILWDLTDTNISRYCTIINCFVFIVSSTDGYTYERSAIVSWFRRGKITSPLTNEPLLSKSMTPNVTVKEAIVVFIKENQ